MLPVPVRSVFGFLTWWVCAGIIYFLVLLVPRWFFGWSPSGAYEVIQNLSILVGVSIFTLAMCTLLVRRRDRAAMVGMLLAAIPAVLYYLLVILLFSGLLENLVPPSVRSRLF